MYRKPTGKDAFVSIILGVFLGFVVGAILGLFLASPIGMIVGAVLGIFMGLGQAGRSITEKEKSYHENQQLVMQKVQNNVPLNENEQSLWNEMNNITQPKTKKFATSPKEPVKTEKHSTSKLPKGTRWERKAQHYQRLANDFQMQLDSSPNGFWSNRYRKLIVKYTRLAEKYKTP